MSETISVIVIDDHPLYRSGVVRSLEESGEFMVCAEGGSAGDALRVGREHAPDIALIDVSMPGGGIRAVEMICALGQETRPVMLTVSERDDDILRALEAGARGYALKGVGADELAGILRTVASGGSYVSPSLAARLLVAMRNPREAAGGLNSLTAREEQILRLVAAGKSNKEVGRQLNLQEKTVKHYMTSILQKLSVRNRTEAAVKAQEAWNI